MKRIVAILVAALICLSVASCQPLVDRANGTKTGSRQASATVSQTKEADNGPVPTERGDEDENSATTAIPETKKPEKGSETAPTPTEDDESKWTPFF